MLIKNTKSANPGESEIQFISDLNSEEYFMNAKLANAVLSFTNEAPINMVKLIEFCKVKEYYYNTPVTFSGRTIKFFINYNDAEIKLSLVFFKTGKVVSLGLKKFTPEFLVAVQNAVFNILTQSEASQKVALTYVLANKVYCFEIKQKYFAKPLTYWYNILPHNLKLKLEYNPAIFPGATLRVPTSKAAFLIFNSRKVIITGGTTDINTIIDSLDFLKKIITYVYDTYK